MAKLLNYRDLSLKRSVIVPGHTLCPGCMESIMIQNVGKATDNGHKTIFTIGTGCAEVSTLNWPNYVSWGRGLEPPKKFVDSFAIIHHMFESAMTLAEASRDVADMLIDMEATPAEDFNVVALTGDGGGLAIGLRGFLHTIHRKAKIVIMLMINEFYANTGFQYGPTATLFADTSTTPAGDAIPGNIIPPMSGPALALAAGAEMVAQISPAFPQPFAKTVQQAIEISKTRGTAAIFVPTPCITGWKYPDGNTIELARLIAKAGISPTFIKIRGEKGKVQHYEKDKDKRREALLKFMVTQRRFQHIAYYDKKKKEIVVINEEALKELEDWIEKNIAHLHTLAEVDIGM